MKCWQGVWDAFREMNSQLGTAAPSTLTVYSKGMQKKCWCMKNNGGMLDVAVSARVVNCECFCVCVCVCVCGRYIIYAVQTLLIKKSHYHPINNQWQALLSTHTQSQLNVVTWLMPPIKDRHKSMHTNTHVHTHTVRTHTHTHVHGSFWGALLCVSKA